MRSCASPPGRRASRCPPCRGSRSTTIGTSSSDPATRWSSRPAPFPATRRPSSRVINHLARRGVDVIQEGARHVHVSGHGSEEELKLVLSLVRPKYFVPIHGEYRQLARHARVAERVTAGLRSRTEVLLIENGDVLRFDARRRARRGQGAGRARAHRRHAGPARSCDEVLRDRRHLAEDGLLVPVVAINKQTGAIEGEPDVVSRGMALDSRSADLLRDSVQVLRAGHRVGETRGAHRSGADQGEDPRRAAPVLPEAVGSPAAGACRSSWRYERGRVDTLAPRERVRRRGAVRGRADLVDRPGHATSQPIRCGSSAPARTLCQPTSSAVSGRSSPSCRFSCFGLRVVPDSGHVRRDRLALLLVPVSRCAVHEAHRRRASRRTAPVPFSAWRSGSQTASGAGFRPGGYVGEWLAAFLAEYLEPRPAR